MGEGCCQRQKERMCKAAYQGPSIPAMKKENRARIGFATESRTRFATTIERTRINQDLCGFEADLLLVCEGRSGTLVKVYV